MGFLSQAGHLGLKTQAVKGTYLDPGAVAPDQGVFVRTRSGSMGGNRDLLVPDPEIGGNRDVPDAQLGPISFSGEFDIYPRWESIPFFLKGVFGSATSAGAVGTGFTHTIGLSDADIPWISVEEKIANGYEAFKYTDSKINTFHLEADASGFLMGTAGLIALKQEILDPPTDLVAQRVDNSPLITGTQVVVRWNNVQLPARSFSMDVTNNLEDDDFRLGSLFLGDLVPKRREVTMGVTIRPQDATLWRTAMWGGPAATQPLSSSFKDDVIISIISTDDIPGAAGVKYQMDVTIPKAVIAPFNPEPSGDDVLEHDLEIRALRPDPAVALLSATVKNSFATVP